MTLAKRTVGHLADAGGSFSCFELGITRLHVIGSLRAYFTCEFIADTTNKLSLCKQNKSVLTPQPRILIVMNGGKKWVKVGAHQTGGAWRRGRCFEVSRI